MKRILRKIIKELSKMDDIKAVILYGSFARDEYTSRSDIDLLILATDRKAEREMQDRVIELESETGRSIQPTIRTIDELEKTDTGLLQNIFQEGKILFLREPAEIPSAALLQQRPCLIYTFQIRHLGQSEKAKINRRLYGQKRKGYEYKGLLEEMGGKKLSPGCLIVPYAQKEKIEKFFKRFKVEFERLRIWK